MDHDTVIADWKQNAYAHDEATYRFLRSLKFADDETKVDKLAGRLHTEAFQIIDCTRCANCCKTMIVVLSQSDVERISRHLGMTTEAFVDRYLAARDDGEYEVRQKPCSFLGSDDRCTIYEVRPTACREFPNTDKEGFTFRTIQHAENTANCPAVFWIVEQMRKRMRGRRWK